MASGFRVRPATATANETVSGRKIIRRRRYASDAAHPYLRPESPPPSENPSWISGLLAPVLTIAAGAGKLLTSVFLSDCSSGSSSSSSSDSDSDSDDDELDDYNNDASICSKEDEKSNQNGMAPVSTKDNRMYTQPTAHKSESKRAIELLLLQETFTRDECKELMKIIQSRVVDCPNIEVSEDATQKVLHGRTADNDISFPGSWRSLLHLRRSPEAYPYSINGLSTPSPRVSALQVHAPDICITAITEAKKWLEEKKLELSPNSEQGHGLFPLSTDVLPHVKGDVTSPVDMAKSYMQSRPPWRPLSSNNFEFRTPPPIHNYMDENSHPMACYSLPSTKELKRSSLSIGSWNTIEETRRVRLKSTDDILEHHALEQIDSSAVFDNEPSQNLSVPDKGVLAIARDSSTLPAVDCNASPNLPMELAVDESCQNGVLYPSDETGAEVNILVTNSEDRTEHLTSIRSISQFEETLSPEDMRHGISSSATLPSEAEQSGPEKDLDEARMKEELATSHTSSHVPDCILEQHEGAGDLSVEKSNSEPEVMPSEGDGCVLSSDADAVTNYNSAHVLSPQTSPRGGKPAQIENTSQLHESPDLEEAYSLHGPILKGEDQLQKEANGVGNSDDANGLISFQTSLSMAVNAEPGLRPDETTQDSTSSDHHELEVDRPPENCKVLNDILMEVPTTNESKTSGRLQNGSSELMNVAPEIQPQKKSNTRTTMRGKKAGYSRRGRGRGRAK